MMFFSFSTRRRWELRNTGSKLSAAYTREHLFHELDILLVKLCYYEIVAMCMNEAKTTKRRYFSDNYNFN